MFVICVFVECPVYVYFADTHSRRCSSNIYYCFCVTDKYSTKGLSKRHNDIDKDTFLTVLTNRRSGDGFNRGFRARDSSVLTYVQEGAALTYFYGKRKVPLNSIIWKERPGRLARALENPPDVQNRHLNSLTKHQQMAATTLLVGQTEHV